VQKLDGYELYDEESKSYETLQKMLDDKKYDKLDEAYKKYGIYYKEIIPLKHLVAEHRKGLTGEKAECEAYKKWYGKVLSDIKDDADKADAMVIDKSERLRRMFMLSMMLKGKREKEARQRVIDKFVVDEKKRIAKIIEDYNNDLKRIKENQQKKIDKLRKEEDDKKKKKNEDDDKLRKDRKAAKDKKAAAKAARIKKDKKIAEDLAKEIKAADEKAAKEKKEREKRAAEAAKKAEKERKEKVEKERKEKEKKAKEKKEAAMRAEAERSRKEEKKKAEAPKMGWKERLAKQQEEREKEAREKTRKFQEKKSAEAKAKIDREKVAAEKKKKQKAAKAAAKKTTKKTDRKGVLEEYEDDWMGNSLPRVKKELNSLETDDTVDMFAGKHNMERTKKIKILKKIIKKLKKK